MDYTLWLGFIIALRIIVIDFYLCLMLGPMRRR